MWARRAAATRRKTKPLRQDIHALLADLTDCVENLRAATRTPYVRTAGSWPRRSFGSTEKAVSGRVVANNYSSWVPEYSSYYDRLPSNNPELLVVSNPFKGGRTVKRRTRRTRRRGRSRRRNSPLTVRYKGHSRTWRGMVKILGVKGAQKIWRKKRKHHGYVKGAITPLRARYKRRAANPRRRRRKTRRNAPLRVKHGRTRHSWRGLVKKLGVKKAARVWRRSPKYHAGKAVNPRRRRKRRSNARRRRRFRRRRN